MADNEHKAKRYLSDTFGVVVAGQLNFNTFFGTSGSQIDLSSKASTILNIEPYFAKVENVSSAILNPLFQTLNTPVSHATSESSEYQLALTNFQNKVYFLWGSIYQGGVFIFIMDNQRYIGEIVGHYVHWEQDLERFYETHVPVYVGELAEVAFCYTYYGGTSVDGGSYGGIELIRPNDTSNPVITMRSVDMVDAHYTYPDSSQYTIPRLKGAFSNSGFVEPITHYEVHPTIIVDGLNRVGGWWFVDTESYTMPNYINDFGMWYGDEMKKQPDTGDGVSGDDGGNEEGSDEESHKEPVTPASQFTVDGINSGMITLYNPTSAEVQSFCDFLFAGITENMSAVLKRLVVSPLEYVISLNMCHFMPTVGAAQRIKFCGIDSGVTSFKITKQFEPINCGSVTIKNNFYGFLDYGGFTSAKIYLPYCGIYPLNIDEIMGGTVHVHYWIDLMSGSCIAQVEITNDDHNNLIDEDVIYEFTGNCYESMPLSATDYRGTVQGLMSVVSGVAAVAMGQPAGMGSVATGVLSMKPDVIHGGNMSTSFGYMGKQIPYIILSRPVKKPPLDFNYMRGYPANITKTISALMKDAVGYCEIVPNTLDLENIQGITDSEKEELQTLLTNGVFF